MAVEVETVSSDTHLAHGGVMKEALLALAKGSLETRGFRQHVADGADERLDLVRRSGVLVGLRLSQLVDACEEDACVGWLSSYGSSPVIQRTTGS
jgi:hypothetical protein